MTPRAPSDSLMALVDEVNDAHFWGRSLPADRRKILAGAIARRQGAAGAYAATFALSPAERTGGIKLFTGEPTQSAAARHIAGEEACRALRLLKPADRAARAALQKATENLLGCLSRSEAMTDHRMGGNPGLFCCGRCSVAVWRHLLAGGLDRREERLAAGIKRLRQHRTQGGRWNTFPFWYMILALIEADVSEAIAELQHAAPLLKRAASRRSSDASSYAQRRHEIAVRAMALV
jgi:hypothetical protein